MYYSTNWLPTVAIWLPYKLPCKNSISICICIVVAMVAMYNLLVSIFCYIFCVYMHDFDGNHGNFAKNDVLLHFLHGNHGNQLPKLPYFYQKRC